MEKTSDAHALLGVKIVLDDVIKIVNFIRSHQRSI